MMVKGDEMKNNQEKLLTQLSDAVFEMEDEDIIPIAEEYVSAGFDVREGVMKGLIPGMSRAGELFAEEEYYVTDILLCSDALNNALEIFKPYLEEEKESENRYTYLIGTVAGDTHDIGKNLVKIMLEVGGFEVIDLGRDVPLELFVEKAVEYDVDIIGMSALMTTTMDGIKTVINMLKEQGLRAQFKVMAGGGAVTESYAKEIGADGYAPDAIRAVELAKNLVGIES